MFKAIQVARVCLAVAAVLFLSQISAPATAANQCWRGWHAQAEKNAELGLRLLHGGNGSDHVRLWRLLELGEGIPDGGRYGGYTELGVWDDTWRNTQDSYSFLAIQAARRGVSWPQQRGGGNSWPKFNVRFAAKMFAERRDLLGDRHPYLTDWMRNQAAMFYKASGVLTDYAAHHTGLAAQLAAEDFQYQSAALLFHDQQYDAAVAAFRGIAAQGGNRYRDIAAYLAIRSLVHAERYREAVQAIDESRNDSTLANVHAIIRQLIGVISWRGWSKGRQNPEIRDAGYRLLIDVAKALQLPRAALQSDETAKAEYWQAIYDLQFFLRSDGSRDWLRGRIDDDWWIDPAVHRGDSAWASAFALAAADDGLLDWLQSVQQVRSLAAGPWLVYWSDRTASGPFRKVQEHVRQCAEAGDSLAWAIADAMYAQGYATVAKAALQQIDTKMGDCLASHAEQLARGPLRYHLARMATLGERSYFNWRRPERGEIENLIKADADTRAAWTMFLLSLSGTARHFGSAPENSEDINRLVSSSLAEFLAVPDRYGTSDAKTAVINMLPVRTLVQLAGDETLPEEFRATIVRNAWTRAHLLNDEDALAAATDLLPRLNLGLSELVEDYRSAWTDAGRKRATLRLLLKAPAMQLTIPATRDMAFQAPPNYRKRSVVSGPWSWFLSIRESAKASAALFWADSRNPNDGNWWCQADVPRLQRLLERDFYNVPLALESDRWYRWSRTVRGDMPNDLQVFLSDRRRDFLIDHPVLKLIDWEELGRLSKVPAAPDYLTGEAIAWVKNAGWLDRWLHEDEMAEALALAIRVDRFGCRRDGTNRTLSYAAYRLLHEQFPDSAAAAHTRYWYD